MSTEDEYWKHPEKVAATTEYPVTPTEAQAYVELVDALGRIRSSIEGVTGAITILILVLIVHWLL